jgi:anaerobic selenocysteine-containing dehydrogenase
MNLSRRDFLKMSGAVSGVAMARYLHLQLLEPVNVLNPLADYPDRGWEEIYRNQYAYDSSFTYVCSPNDTHACRLRAFVRNGVILRSETNYDVDQIRRPLRQQGHRPLAPARLQKRANLPPPRLRAAPPQRPHHAPGLEELGR